MTQADSVARLVQSVSVTEEKAWRPTFLPAFTRRSSERNKSVKKTAKAL